MLNLASVLSAERIEDRATGGVDIELETLAALPPTAEITEQLATRQQQIEALRPADGTPSAVQAMRRFLAGRIKHLIADLAHAKLRDDLQADRPAECWCLGLGGLDRKYLGPTDADPDAERYVWGRYCVCVEAQEARVRDDGYRSDRDQTFARRRLLKVWGGAGVPERFREMSLDTYPANFQTANLVGNLRSWIGGDRWLLLHGTFGTGKTGLAIGLLRELAGRGKTILFSTTADVLSRLRQTYSDESGSSEAEVMGTLREVDVLCLDDIGAERFTGWVGEKLFVLINHRHNAGKRTIITSNLTPAQLTGHLGERTMWRISELSDIVHVVGPNLRMAS